jgi:hypothetical protein
MGLLYLHLYQSNTLVHGESRYLSRGHSPAIPVPLLHQTVFGFVSADTRELRGLRVVHDLRYDHHDLLLVLAPLSHRHHTKYSGVRRSDRHKHGENNNIASGRIPDAEYAMIFYFFSFWCAWSIRHLVYLSEGGFTGNGRRGGCWASMLFVFVYVLHYSRYLDQSVVSFRSLPLSCDLDGLVLALLLAPIVSSPSSLYP